jgi:hypothetical protein
VNRNNLTNGVRERLKRLPPPYEAHYGVVPPPPPEEGLPVGQVLARLSAADTALAKKETLAAELKDPYLISRILPRREAVSSSAIEGTNSTLDELLSIEENEDSEQGDAAVQVRLPLMIFCRARAQNATYYSPSNSFRISSARS